MKHRKDQKVVAAYPHPHEVSARFHKCWDALRQYDFTHRRRIADGGGHLANSSGANVTNARNEIVAAFLDRHDADWLWFVDTDMTFEPDVLDRLVDAAHPTLRPIMGALCFSLQDGWRAAPTLYVIRPDGRTGRVLDYPRGKQMRVLTGSGCLLIHRSALETMRDRAFNPAYPWFQESHVGSLPMGEDITFCIRAEAAGIPVHVDTSIRCGHEKPFLVDEAMYEAQRGWHEPADPNHPTFAVIASRSRPDMLANLRAQLEPQTTDVFVFDNGYENIPAGCIPAHDWPLHRMWNEGLDLAANAAQGPHNVLVINDDVDAPPHLCARLEAGLRVDDNNWIAYPGSPAGEHTNPSYAHQTVTGWCMMLRGEAGLRFDEQFEWWYGDSDLEATVRAQGKHVVAVPVDVTHLDPMRSTLDNPDRLAQARDDEARYAKKWGLDPASLWLAVNRP